MTTASAGITEEGIPRQYEAWMVPAEPFPVHGERLGFFTTLPATAGDRTLALTIVAISALFFVAALPFAKVQLAPVWGFIPAYQSALILCDLVTAALLLGQVRFSRSRPLLMLAAAYLYSACLTVAHTLSFPGLFAPAGVIGGGAQTTAWLYMFWHGGFPLLVIAYGVLPESKVDRIAPQLGVALVCIVALVLLATRGEALLPPIMTGNRMASAIVLVVGTVWALSLTALIVVWRRRSRSALDVWVMVVLCAWIFDIGLAAVFNGGRFDLGFYAGRIYGLFAASFVLFVLLLENSTLHARLAIAHEHDQRSLSRHAERLRILAAIDQAMIAERPADAIAAAVIQPLRALLDVPRAIVNRFDLSSGTVEWVAAAGRRRSHVGPGVRYSLALMGDLDALRRGEVQRINTRALQAGPDVDALLASGVRWYLVVPMIAGGELIGAISFGGDSEHFSDEQTAIAREVAAQLAIATTQTHLLERVRAHAAELDSKVRSRTAELEAVNKELESFSYSVSHDLRSPLRAIDGYSRMLEEDYGGKLDAEAQRLIGVVRGNARRMGQLIDDLLAFSRLGRQPTSRSRVDMTRMASEVIEELRGASTAEIKLGALPEAHADPALVRQVWVNLVGNAVKYSGKVSQPRIEISARDDGAQVVYCVRDNGAGFDMRYAGKLFGVFQRLHRSEEFEGTGVGLAIVKRVVTRHGGRVWAESAPGNGAAFFFTLPRGTSDG